MRKLVAFLSLLVLIAAPVATQADTTATSSTISSLQEQINANNDEITQLNAEIAKYQTELQQTDANKKTLQSAINALDLQRTSVQTQISAIQKQIDTTQLQITQLGIGISDTQSQVTANQDALGEEMRNLQEDNDEPLLLQVLASNDLSEAWDNIESILEIQDAVQSKVQTLQGQETTLASSQAASKQEQNLLDSQKQTYTSKQAALAQTTKTKAQLLAETNAQESTYEKLLAQAKAQLAGFSTFTQSAGGSGLLQNQTACDAWGCYYNQRDAAWGNDLINGTQYRFASDGCLITAMAMVMTHYGYPNVTPVSINANPNNFAAYYPAYLLFTISVDGVSATRKTAAIDATLSTGNPVIVGLNAYGGTHYVVLVSGSNGNYIMRDPYIPNGKDVSFTAHYSLGSIFGISSVQVTG